MKQTGSHINEFTHNYTGTVGNRAFYVVCVKGLYSNDNSWAGVTRVEAGSNTSTVTLQVVGSGEKGSLESETVKYGNESYGTRTQKWLRWWEPVAIANDRPVLLSERAPQINKPATGRQ
jgi:hypothetical protein